jgi:hypothetical protein
LQKKMLAPDWSTDSLMFETVESNKAYQKATEGFICNRIDYNHVLEHLDKEYCMTVWE